MNSRASRIFFRILRILLLACLIILMPVLIGQVTGQERTITPARSARSLAESNELYRTRVRLQHPRDLERVQGMVTSVLETGENEALVTVDEDQLADLARLGFHPQETIAFSELGLQQKEGALPQDKMILTSAAALDSDNDGLTDTEEDWWCTDPFDDNSDSPLPPDAANPSDGEEVAAILEGITAYGPPFPLWPQFMPYNPNGSCPDGDYDGVPDYAEEFIIGTSQLRESSDKDKFDDGQELFGVTFCPASGGSCGYGILPRAEDSEFVSANLPAWVLPPGNSPWVAAFPEPEVEIVPSSIRVNAVTTITTSRTITEGEEHTYESITKQGSSITVREKYRWGNFQSLSRKSQIDQASFQLSPQLLSSSEDDDRNIVAEAVIFHLGCHAAAFFIAPGAGNIVCFAFGAAHVGGYLVGNMDTETETDYLVPDSTEETEVVDISNDDVTDVGGQNDCLGDGNTTNSTLSKNSNGISCSGRAIGTQIESDENFIRGTIDEIDTGNSSSTSGTNYDINDNDKLVSRTVYESKIPIKSASTINESLSIVNYKRGSRKTKTTQYFEQTITQSSTHQFSESWTYATAVDTAHAADLRFTYNITNDGTEYAREISSLLFNIYIGIESIPAHTYIAVGNTGQISLIENLFPEDSVTFTSTPIPLTLEEMRLIDEGAPIRIVLEDIAFGQDQVFYQDALNGSVQIFVDDGVDDGDEIIDEYLIPVWAQNDSLQDVIKRYFPVIENDEGTLTSISTPEFDSNPPVFYDRLVSLSSWFMFYLSDAYSANEPIYRAQAVPGSSILLRFVSDGDLDGYNDRSELRLGTNPDDVGSGPTPELLAGYTTTCAGDDCTVLLSFQNDGNYDAYGIEAVMYSPDGQADITNNTIGGGGRVNAGTQIAVGSLVIDPDLTNWGSDAQPYSTGYYLGAVDRTYTFTAQDSGGVGQSAPLTFQWSDGLGGTGTIDFGSDYQSPLPLPVAEGLELGFLTGLVNAGDAFTVETRTPRDTFQYTKLDPGAAEPIILVSYNDPQGNHRFIVPTGNFPAGGHLNDLNIDLTPLSGKMLEGVGLEIVTTSGNEASFILNSSHQTPIADAHLAVEYLDSDGQVVNEDVIQQTILPGPNVVSITVDLNTYDPAEHTLLAFFTDSQGNILDAAARPLYTFKNDPSPTVTVGIQDWQTGQHSSLNGSSIAWDLGSMAVGQKLSAKLALANNGQSVLKYAFDPLASELTLNGDNSGTIPPGEAELFTVELDTLDMTTGSYSQTISLRTNEPQKPIVNLNISGTLTGSPGTAFSYTPDPLVPWEEQIVVNGVQQENAGISVSHLITDEADNMYPMALYDVDSVLLSYGEYGGTTGNEKATYEMFGDGRDGDLLVQTGETITAPIDYASISGSISIGAATIPVTSTVGFSAGDTIMIHQSQGVSPGGWELAEIDSVGAGDVVLTLGTTNTYIDDASNQAQVVRIPQYDNCTVETGGLLTVKEWDGNTGGILPLKCVSLEIQGIMRVSGGSPSEPTGGRGGGFRGGDGRHITGTGSGYQGEGWPGIGGLSYLENGNGGGSFYRNSGGIVGGGGGGGNGAAGQDGSSYHVGTGSYGKGGLSAGSEDLSIMLFGGGGGGATYDNDNAAGGSSGAGILALWSKSIVVTGSLGANGGRADNIGWGGGGAGGSVLIKSTSPELGLDKVAARGGTATDNRAGDGGVGRIRVEYCDNLSGQTDPVASTEELDCYLIRQNYEGSSGTSWLIMPESLPTDSHERYIARYGQRNEFSAAGNHLYMLRVPNQIYSSFEIESLLKPVVDSNNVINYCLDVGDDSTCDWQPAQMTFTETLSINPDPADVASMTNALNSYILSQASSAETILVPMRVSIDTSADVLLFNPVLEEDYRFIDLTPLTIGITVPGGITADTIPEGTQVTLEAQITNSGITKATDFTVAFYNWDPDAGGTLIDSVFVSELAASGTTSKSVVWDTSGLLGPYDVFVKVDASSTSPESDETNNINSFSVVIRSKPDLTPISLTIPEAQVGEAIILSAVIVNNGEADALNVPITLYSGPPLTGTVIAIDTIDVAAQSSGIAEWQWTPAMVGSNEVSVAVDAPDDLAEADEENNSLSSLITVGWGALTVDSGGPAQDDPAYDPAAGYGRRNSGSIVNACGSNPEQTYREAGSTETLAYQFDFLQPGRYYHLDLTFATCSGERWIDIFVDDRPVSDTTAETVGSVHVTDQLQTVSVLLDPLDYQDGTVTLSLARASGFSGPILNLIDLHEVAYCYRDSGPGEESWTAANNCGYDPAWYSDGFNGWGSTPAETIRFSESGQVKYKFSNLDPARTYQTRLTFYEEDGLGRVQDVLADSTTLNSVLLGPAPGTLEELLPADQYTDGELILTIFLSEPAGAPAIVSEVALEEITRRYPFSGGGTPPTPTPTPSPTPDPVDPEVVLDSFSAAWNGAQVDVAWATTTEINNAAFELFRSADGLVWAQIHSAPSQFPCGNVTGTDPTPYAFADTTAVPDTTYYYKLHFSGAGCGGGVMVATRVAVAQETAVHNVALASGWNMISSYVEPQYPAMDAVFPPSVRDNLVLCKNGRGEVYWPQYAVNQIGNWDARSGYQCYMSSGDTPAISGLKAVPSLTPLNLPAGWNLIAYLRDAPMPIEAALSTISDEIYLAKNGAGQVYWPGLGIDEIGDMQPGQGYQVYMNSPGTLTYPAND